MKRRNLSILSLLLTFASCSGPDGGQILSKLDAVLEDKAVYESYFEDRVNVLKEVLSEQTGLEQRYSLNWRIADCYRANCIDSVAKYLAGCKEMAQSMGDVAKEAEADFTLARAYVKAGWFVEANDILDCYRDRKLPREIIREYYDTEHTYWGETMAYSFSEASYEEKEKKRDGYRRILLTMTPEGTWEWNCLKREEVHEAEDREQIRFYSEKMVRMTQENTREYAEACYFYAHSFDPSEPEYELWLVRSAIADVMCANKDYASLNELSRLLFNKGDIDRAFRYAADHCMADALSYNGKLRPWQISKFFPEIEKAYQAKHSRQTRFIIILLAILSVLLSLLMIILVIAIRRQWKLDAMKTKLQESNMEIEARNRDLVAINNRLRDLNSRLQEADKVKEEYITLFLGMVSDNITSSRQYRNRVLKYIRQGNTKVIVEEIEQMNPIDNDILDFYKMFDQTFVNLYPDFVTKFNSLLAEGSEIVPKGDDILTPELRIFALVKLGITDSSRIASLLHYSANTIYNYRAKTKNKARGSREDFEDAVRNIE